jgi:hypothetical protein
MEPEAVVTHLGGSLHEGQTGELDERPLLASQGIRDRRRQVEETGT